MSPVLNIYKLPKYITANPYITYVTHMNIHCIHFYVNMFSFPLNIDVRVELLGHIIVFNLLRNGQTAYQRGCTISHSQQWCTKMPIYPYTHQYMLLCVIFVCSHSVRWEVVAHCGLNLHFPYG